MTCAYDQKKTAINKVIAPACRLARPRARVVIIGLLMAFAAGTRKPIDLRAIGIRSFDPLVLAANNLGSVSAQAESVLLWKPLTHCASVEKRWRLLWEKNPVL